MLVRPGAVSPLQASNQQASLYSKPKLSDCSYLTRLANLQDQQQAPTVYTVRLTTGFTRGSGLNEPLAGVHLCLVSATGEAVLHWISPIFDPAKLQDELEAIGKVCYPPPLLGSQHPTCLQQTACVYLVWVC